MVYHETVALREMIKLFLIQTNLCWPNTNGLRLVYGKIQVTQVLEACIKLSCSSVLIMR